MARQGKFNQKFSLFWPPLSIHCALCIYIIHHHNQASLINRNTCSTIKTNILLAATRQVLKKITFFLHHIKGHDDI